MAEPRSQKTQPDRPLVFPDWTEALAASGLPERVRRSTEVAVRWYLSFCRRSRVGVCHQSARDFIAAVERERQPAGWQVEAWREAIRWFFRTGRALDRSRIARPEPCWPGGDATGDGVVRVDGGGEARCGLKAGWERELQRQLRVGHYAYRTEQTYVDWARRFVHFHAGRPLESLGERDLKRYLDHLAVVGRVSASTQRQALNALVFLLGKVAGLELGDFGDYARAEARSRMPVVLTREEVRHLLDALDGSTRLMAQVMYGGGLRLLELLRLRVKDLDLERRQITVRCGKGAKDRVTTLPEVVLPELGRHLERLRALHAEDQATGRAGVWLPEALGRKYPRAGQEWSWQWV